MLSKIIYFPIGWCYLWLRYRNNQKIKIVLEEKYHGDYQNAGSDIFPTLMGGLLLIAIVLFLLGVIKNAIWEEAN